MSSQKLMEVANNLQLFFRDACDCKKICSYPAGSRCKKTFVEDFIEELTDSGMAEPPRRCAKCKRGIYGSFFIPEGDLEFCGLPCHTSWMTGSVKRRKKREAKFNHAAELLAPGDGRKTRLRKGATSRGDDREGDG